MQNIRIYPYTHIHLYKHMHMYTYTILHATTYVDTYRIAGKFGRGKLCRIDSFRAFGELIDQPIGY